MTNELLSKENITTFATWIAIAVTALVSYIGIELDTGALIPLVSAIITFIIAVYSSKHPNTLSIFDNDAETVTVEIKAEDVQETINDLIEKYEANNTIEPVQDEVDEDGI